MSKTRNSWDDRLDQVVTWLHWITLAIGVFVAYLEYGAVAGAYASSAFAGTYVLVITVVPGEYARRRLVREGLIVGGSVLTMAAVAATDILDSPFLLLALMPVLFAGIRGGFRAGTGSAALSTAILASMVIPLQDPDWVRLIQWGVLLFLVAITFGYAHRLLTEEGMRSSALAAASIQSSARLERLETAHRLLTRLAANAETAELNPIEVGKAALESVRGVVPFRAAIINLASEAGMVAVARVGEAGDEHQPTNIPLKAGERVVGSVVLAVDNELLPRQLESIATVLQPAALAFSNVLLLQGIARTAIQEERARLARDLHDDIGPSLASLGLALDLAAIQYPTEPALGAHLQQLRDSVERLVEDVRSTVDDLRVPDDAISLRDTVHEAIRNRPGDKPTILYEVNERNSIRPSLAADINAIVREALRNAIAHSQASTVTVRGLADFNTGVLEIRDNGKGFNPHQIDTNRYGVIGMKERADRIGAKLAVESKTDGTTVSLSWGDQ